MASTHHDFTPDGLLLQQFLTNENQDSFRQLVERHSPMILGTARRILGDHSEAADVSQSTFLALARKAHFFTGQQSVAGWLHRVARQMALDVLLSRQRRQKRENTAAHFSAAEAYPLDRDTGFQLEEALAALPDRYRSILVTHYSSGGTIEETARALGCSASAASMRLTRGREKLRTVLKRRGVLGVVLPTMLLPIVVPSHLPAQTLLAVKNYLASQQASVGFAAWLRYCERAASFALSHFKATATATALVAIVVVGLANRSQSEDRPVAATSHPPTAPASTPAILEPEIRPAPPADDGSSLLAAMLKDDGFMRLAFKKALDRNRLDINSIHDATGRGLLHIAAEETLVNQFILLLVYGADANARDASGKTPLHYVIHTDAEYARPMRDGLVLRGANVNAADNDGITPLMIAAREGNFRGAEILLWLGADPAPKNVPRERWPIELARQHGKADLVSLLEASQSPGIPTFSRAPKQIPGFVQRSFNEAARLGDFDRLQALIPYGAQINGLDDQGSTALIQAVFNQQSDVITYLLMMKANPNVADKNGVTPFMATSGWFGMNSDWMRDMLILAGADPQLVTKSGHNSLTFASFKGNEHAAQWAIWMGANPKAAAPIGTPMRIASQEGQQKIINLLRLNGVTEPLYVERDPARRLILAARRDDSAEVLALLAQGVPIDSVDENGNNAVMNAIYSQRLDMARLLLNKGSVLNFENPKNGTTPLHATTVWRYYEIEKFRNELLEAGADPNQPDHGGVTPFIAACSGGDLAPKITQMLEHGAKLNLRDKKGRTALWHSHQNGNTEAYEFLKTKGAIE